jgi:CheY-like chemotaxis protein
MKRILIVDDDPLVRGTLHALLARHGYVVEDADNGKRRWTLSPANRTTWSSPTW